MVKMESVTAANDNFPSNPNLPTQETPGKVSVIQNHTEQRAGSGSDSFIYSITGLTFSPLG